MDLCARVATIFELTSVSPLSQIVPFPRSFPWELLLLVLEESDLPILAMLGRVNMDLLEASAPLLYGRTIEIRTPKQLQALFCERKVSARRLLVVACGQC